MSKTAPGSIDDPLMWPAKDDEPDVVRRRRDERNAIYDRASVTAFREMVARDRELELRARIKATIEGWSALERAVAREILEQ